MTGYEALESFCSAFTLAANLVVAIVCLSAFQRLRIAALMLLGISAALAVFTILTETLLLRRIHDESTYAVIWTGTTILWVIDIGLYAIGVTTLVAWITKQKKAD
jgi:hypothetical protein